MWNNIKDKLPEKSGIILCYSPSYDGDEFNGVRLAYFDGASHRFLLNGKQLFPTHWTEIYIPDLPKELWVNLYKLSDGSIITSTNTYSTKEAAEKKATNSTSYVKTIKIEV